MSMLYLLIGAIGCDDPLRWQTRTLLQQEVEATVRFDADQDVRTLAVSVDLAEGVYNAAWQARFEGYAFDPYLGDFTLSYSRDGVPLGARRFDEDGLI
ncbi:MAG: hypothetical protein AAF602_18875, partial [Myxococcota bacterium]